jgi:hypothetical protein
MTNIIRSFVSVSALTKYSDCMPSVFPHASSPNTQKKGEPSDHFRLLFVSA